MATIIEVVQPVGTQIIEIAVPGIQGPGPSQEQVDIAMANVGTNNPDANSLMRRDASGSTVVYRVYSSDVSPSDNAQLVRKDYVDAIGDTNFNPNTIVRRDSNGWIKAQGIFGIGNPNNATDVTNKGYVDARDVALTSISATPPFLGKIAVVDGVGYLATGTTSVADWKQITN